MSETNITGTARSKRNMSFLVLMVIMLASLVLMLSSCVTQKQFNEVKGKYQKAEDENTLLRQQNQDLSTNNSEISAAMAEMKKRMSRLEQDTSALGKSVLVLQESVMQQKDSYSKLLAENEKLRSVSTEEGRKLMGKISSNEMELQKKEDALKKATAELNQRTTELSQKKSELEAREKKLAELQQILHQKDSTVNALKTAVSGALLGFKDQGLSVEQKNGKVYVSMEERLLFASGSTTVDPKGQEALKQLAKVLEQKPDINVMVEGHTDDVPMKGSGDIKDNWDLSVMRATAVVKILLSNSNIDPKRLSAAGRGEHFPLEAKKSPEARKKNRRTEVILTPKLDELLRIME